MVIERIRDHITETRSRIDTKPIILPDMASQFEAVFLQSMLKTSCIDQHFAKETSPFITSFESELPHTLNRGITPIEKSTIIPEIEQTEVSQAQDNQSLDEFVKSIWPYARQASNLIGLDPKILMAQLALETGWGQFIAKDTDGSSSNNLFNIKAKKDEQSVNVKTTEYMTNTPIRMMASFKKYRSVEHGFKDYISLINGERYRTALANAHDPQRYVDALYQAGYATDPAYANKILSIYHGDELQRALDRNGCS